MPANTLSSPPVNTCSTITLVGSMVTTISDPAASCFSVSGAVPPCCCTKLFATSRRESLISTGKPAFTRQAAIGQPMLPTPMKPTVGLLSGIIDFLEHFGRDLERFQARRDAAVSTNLHQDFLDLVPRHA